MGAAFVGFDGLPGFVEDGRAGLLFCAVGLAGPLFACFFAADFAGGLGVGLPCGLAFGLVCGLASGWAAGFCGLAGFGRGAGFVFAAGAAFAGAGLVSACLLLTGGAGGLVALTIGLP
ncbi:MAG TPA: hypothetical protein VML19_01625, partial [Verrucomicrobiae bacterium]|nr:hypothetical protein [Verrucomicrobiae bacterium]